jgi:crotonobetainyl-CoA:carnitine CoA-transferase CaiB-like acyl-CoA transferase
MLADITILDLSLQLPGPYATMLLRSLGARVIKIEPPGGDLARLIDPPMFETLNAGKESLELDLRVPSSRELLLRLAARCDVAIEGFRPGVAARLGASYDDLARVRADIVYCSLSGYGQDGPYRSLPGHDLNYLGVGGGAADATVESTKPEHIGVPVIDLASGTAAALSIVAALRDRDRTGAGCYLDVAMIDSAVVWSNLKWEPSSAPGEPAYGVFRTGDGRLLSLAVIEDKFWLALCDVLAWADWRDDPAFRTHAARKEQSQRIVERLVDALAERTREQWLEAFARADVPAAPVHDGDEVASDPQVVARRLFVNGPERIRPPLPEALLDAPRRGAPGLGEHHRSIVAELAADDPAATPGSPRTSSMEGVA